MKRIISFILSLCLLAGLDGCASKSESKPSSQSEEKILVVYFSATGNTKKLAERIADLEGADIYEITPKDPYTEEDLKYDDENCRSALEQKDEASRPEIAGDPINVKDYTKIYIGFPIWYGQEPRIIDTFMESYDFSGITMIPFCTSGGSGIHQSRSNLEKLAKYANWNAGDRMDPDIDKKDLQSWVDRY
ncbi:MAG: flavodoxin [Faecalicoccus sp.]|nr:flavodoxin [Faecalicoccus sp.]